MLLRSFRMLPLSSLHSKDRRRLVNSEKARKGSGGNAAAKGSYQPESLVCRISDLEETVESNEEESAMRMKALYQNSSAAWEVIEALQQRIKTLETYCGLYREQMAAARSQLKELYNRQLELMDGEESLEERLHRLEDPGDILPAFPTPNMGSLRMDTR
ncbi:hypothetical protein FPOAC2_07413 [Fusarium poae]